MKKIFITGDTHNDDIERFDAFIEEHPDLDKSDLILIAGDFGTPWKNMYEGHLSKKDKKILTKYEDYPFTTAFVDGNHENFTNLHQFPTEIWMNGETHKLNDSVYHLKRGEIFDFYGNTFLTLGGAESVDWMMRTPYKTWWPYDESISAHDLEHAAENLAKYNNKVDFILTHEMPTALMNKYFALIKNYWDPNPSNRALQNIYADVNYKRWFLGHHHIDASDEKHIVLYHKIIDLDDYKENAEEHPAMIYL